MVRIVSLPDPPEPTARAPKPDSLYIAIPAYGGQLNAAFVACLISLQIAFSSKYAGLSVTIDILGQESLIQRARNLLAARFLKSGATRLLFIDADLTFSPESVFRLLDTPYDVATGVYSKKHVNFETILKKHARGDGEPIAQAGLDFNLNLTPGPGGAAPRVKDGFVEVLDAATGMMMIRRSVFERLEAAHPELLVTNDVMDDPTATPTYTAFFDCMIDPTSRRYLSEDYSFVRRWQSLGGTVWSDLAMPLGHVGFHAFGRPMDRV